MLTRYVTDGLDELKAPTLQALTSFIAKFLLIVTVFTILEMGLYWFSLQYVVYENWVSWYFPVGMRVVAFLLLPFRYWPALMLANGLSQFCFNYVYYEADVFTPERILQIFYMPYLNQAIPLIGIAVVKIKKTPLTIARLKPMLAIMAACLFYRLVRSGYLLTTQTTWLYTDIPPTRLFEMTVAHILGGFTGILNAVAVAFLGIWLWRNKASIDVSKTASFVLQLSLFIGFIYALYGLQPEILYLLKMVAIIPIVWFSYAFGWVGAMSVVLVINMLVLSLMFGVNNTEAMLDNQAFMITYSIAGILIGALVNEHRLANKLLLVKNDELQTSNSGLISLSKKVQALSTKLVDVQEQERKTLSQELHDEVGQNLTALKTTLKVMERKLNSGDFSSEIIHQANKNADHIYGSVYDLMHWLRPRVLDDLGLDEILTGSYFKDKLGSAGIDYFVSIKGQTDSLSDNDTIALFRICQEAVTNTIKHAKAEAFYIDLKIGPTITLHIHDNGVGWMGSHHQSSSTFGLKGIEERVMALGGTLKIDSENGTSILVELPSDG